MKVELFKSIKNEDDLGWLHHLKFRSSAMTLGPSCPHTLDLKLAKLFTPDAPNVRVQARLVQLLLDSLFLPLQSPLDSKGGAVSEFARAHPGTQTRTRTRDSYPLYKVPTLTILHPSLISTVESKCVLTHAHIIALG